MKKPGAQTPAGGSGQTNDCHGKAPPKMGDSNLPKGNMNPGHNGGRKQGSNVGR